MRKLFTNTVYIAVFLLTTIAANAQVTGQYRTKATGDWTSLSTWERYNGTTWATPVHTPNYLDGITTIRAGYNVTLPPGSLTVDQLTVESGGTLTLANGSNLGLYNGAGTDFTCISKTPLQVKSVPAPLYKPRLLPFASIKVPPLSIVNWSTVKDPEGSVTLYPALMVIIPSR